jgi:two-component system chemotaxis response regulator CheV
MNMQEHVYDDELDDEIDLVKLVSSSADVTNQYIVFEGSNGEYYGINVAKVEELFVFDNQNIARNNDKSNHILGVSEIRSHMTSIVCFDDWFGNKKLDETDYEILIFCYFSDEYLGIVVKRIIEIVSIMPQQMQSSSKGNELTTFTAKISIGKTDCLCTIFDTDKMLFDLYGEDVTTARYDSKPILSKKYVLFADDSRLVRKMALDTFEHLGIQFQIFGDGQELIDVLVGINPQDIGIFLLDVEMPRKTGIDVIDYLRNSGKYTNIPIIVHTNMANASISATLQSKGVAKILGKIDFNAIEDSVREYLQ